MTDAGPRLLLGAPIAAEIRASVAQDVAAIRGRRGHAPALAVVIVGSDAPSAVYLNQILRSCEKVGIDGRLVEIPGRASSTTLRSEIERLNRDPLVAGIIVQMPLPKRIPLSTVIDTLDPAKDIDGLHPRNAGLLSLGYEGFLPTTAHAAVEILKRSDIRSLAGGSRSSAAPTSSASRPPSSCCARTPPSRSATARPSTSPATPATPRSWSWPPAFRA